MAFLDFLSTMSWWMWLIVFLVLVIIRDIFFNRRHTISHNFPVVGHIRYFLEKIGPEIRQYFIANNREELPFNRSERTWIYASAKKENNYQGFGSDQDFYAPNYHFIKPAMLALNIGTAHINVSHPDFAPCAKIMGEYNGRKRKYRPRSIVNISAMSFGSLSGPAVESLNKGAHLSGCFHNTGEGGYSPYHNTGADVVFQFGTAYFGVRDADGNFSLDNLEKLVENHPNIRAIEIKLSQGAKPGKGGVLPAAKISAEISKIRHVPMGFDVISPAYHSAFGDVKELLSLIEQIAERTGLPVGIKTAVGKMEMWHELMDLMLETNKGPDFIAIDGGEGGTGAAPPDFADHVSLPFFYAFRELYKLFQAKGLSSRIVFIGAGRLGLPAQVIKAFAMGADLVYIAREAMISIGCIQAQVCHNNTCPTGVATQNKWLTRGIDVPLKSERFANYATNLRKEVLAMAHAAGYEHPCQFKSEDIVLNLGDNAKVVDMSINLGYEKDVVPFDSMNYLYDCGFLGGQKG